MFFNVGNDFVRPRECQCHGGIGSAVIDGDVAGRGVLKRCAGEADVGHEARGFVAFLWRQKEVFASVQHLRGLIDIQYRAAEGIHKAVAGAGDAVVEQQPPFVRLDGRRAASDFDALPPIARAAHHMPVLSPEREVRALAQEDVAKRRVSAVRGTGQHGVVAADLAREQHRVAVKGDVGIFQTRKGLEVPRFRHADGRAVEVLAPDEIVGILHLYETRVIGVQRHGGISALIDKGNFVRQHVPVDAVAAFAQIDVRDAVILLSAQHGNKAVLPWADGTVENTAHASGRISADNGVFAIAPDGQVMIVVRGTLLPGDIGQIRGVQNVDCHALFLPLFDLPVQPTFVLRSNVNVPFLL